MDINVTGLTSEAISAHVWARLSAALDQHGPHVRRVDVRLTDVNGPRGGTDKLCRVDVVMDGRGPRCQLHVEHREHDLYAAISHAADRIKNAVGRRLKRRIARRHGDA